MKKQFFKLVGEKVDVFGKNVVFDKNFASPVEAGEFIENNIQKNEDVKWELYTMTCSY